MKWVVDTVVGSICAGIKGRVRILNKRKSSKDNMTTAKEIAEMILALPEEQQQAPLVFEYYANSEDSVPCQEEVDSITYYETGYPIGKPHICLS